MEECHSHQALFDYLQRELPADQLVRIKAHLRHCESCQSELYRLQQQITCVKTTLARLDPQDANGKFRLEPVQLSADSKRFMRLTGPSAAFAATLFVFVVAALFVWMSNQPMVDQASEATRLGDEPYWTEDPQKDWDDQNVMIRVVDERSRTVEVMQASLRSGRMRPCQLPAAEAE